MTTQEIIREELKQSLLLSIEKERSKQPEFYSFALWKVKNDKVSYNLEPAEKFVENEIEKGYTIEELTFKAKVYANYDVYMEVSVTCENTISGNIQWYTFCQNRLAKKDITKSELEEVLLLENEFVLKNRELILNNPKEARKVDFFQNNLSRMQVDQETHDYILSVINADKEVDILNKETKKQELKAWALAHGSELVKARIEENMNWLELADKEYDRSRMPEGFDYKDEDDFDSCWDYKNPTLEHINALREARKNKVFTKVELRKCRKTDEDGDKTFYYFVVGTMDGYDGEEFEVTKLIEEQFVSAE